MQMVRFLGHQVQAVLRIKDKGNFIKVRGICSGEMWMMSIEDLVEKSQEEKIRKEREERSSNNYEW